MQIISKSLAETESVAKKVFDILKNEKTSGAKVVCLYGNLGAGKTTFTQIFGKLLGVKDTMQSPTFLILKSYETKNIFFEKLIHIDAYRIENFKEILSLGFEEILKEEKTLILIEWPEKIKNILPKNTFDIYFEFVDENTRKIEFKI